MLRRYLIAISLLANIVYCSTGTQNEPPMTLSDLWTGNNEFSRVHYDDHLAVYFDSGTASASNHTAITWPFSPFSKVWKYIKDTYGPFGSDPRLYLILQTNNNNRCNDVPSTSNSFQYRNRVECSQSLRRGGWALNSTENFETILTAIGPLIRKGAKGRTHEADLETARSRMDDVLVYDLYRHLSGLTESSDATADFEHNAQADNTNATALGRWKAEKLIDTELDVYYFRDWFLPLYERFGGASVLDKYYTLTSLYWPKRSTDYLYMNWGEYIHFWSATAGVDLEPLALSVFRRLDDDEEEFIKAVRKYKEFNYSVSVTTENLPSHGPPGKWSKEWNTREVNLSLVYRDDSVAIYSHKFELYPIHSLKSISAMWKYTKEKYGPFSPTDQLLYIALQNGTTDSCTSSNNDSFLDSNSGHGHVIDCSINQGGSNTGSGNTFSRLLEQAITLQIASMPLKLSKSTGNWPGRNVSHWTMTSILAYDIYLGVGKTARAEEWRAQKVNETENFPENETFWFRDWYLKIYENRNDGNNNSSALQNFFSLLNTYWPMRNTSHGQNYAGQLNMGEFVHFWSGATGSSLKYTAINSLKANISNERTYQIELDQARETFPNITRLYKGTLTENLPSHNPPGKWHKQWNDMEVDLSRVYSDDHVAFYTQNFKPLVPNATLLFGHVSDTLKYLKELYGPFGSGSGLEQFFYIAVQNGTADKCTTTTLNNYNNSGSGPGPGNRSVVTIDCSTFTSSNNRNNFGASLDEKIIQEIALQSLKLNHENISWPVYYNVSQWTLSSILVYDIYSNLGKTANAMEWKRLEISKSENFPKNETFWFRDWYSKIYDNFGGSTVLQKFFSILHSSINWPLQPRNGSGTFQSHAKQLNMGEFVHFWSGAAGVCLKDWAVTAFGWSLKSDNQLLEAKLKYFNVSYVFEESNETFPSAFIITNENSFFQVLNKIHEQSQVGVYFDTHMPLLIHWPFHFFTKSWLHLKTNYPNLLNFHNIINTTTGTGLDPHLYVVFRAKERKACESSLTYSISTDGGPRKIPNFIDCGYFQDNDEADRYDIDITDLLENSWGNDTSDNLELLLTSIEILLKAQLGVEKETNMVTKALSSVIKVVIYDLYNTHGREEEARGWLRNISEEGEGHHKISALGGKDWFSDWYIPIYDEYGEGRVLDRFIALLNVRARKTVGTIGNDLNVGEFVHFWSGAANINLRDLAVEAFGWNQISQDQFNQARVDYDFNLEYHQFNYSCPRCNELPGTPIQKEQEADIPFKLEIVALSSVLLTILTCLGLVLSIKITICRRRISEYDMENSQIRKLTAEEVNEFVRGSMAVHPANNGGPSDGNAPIHLMPYDDSYEIAPALLIIDRKILLGSGEFGLVHPGVIKGEQEDGTHDVAVAVKTVKPEVEVTYFKALLSEIKIMAFLGPHPNIVSLLGAVTTNIKNREVLIAIELCDQRDLLAFLTKNQNSFVNLWNDSNRASISSSSAVKCSFRNDQEPSLELVSSFSPIPPQNHVISPNISTINLLEWSRQIAEGMAFLNSKKVIHGDLAARNVLLTAEGIAKISDFGLSRQLIINYAEYMKKSNTPLPWRWMAIESLNERSFSVHSDIWSYGVTLWEIFTLGKLPYGNRTWDPEFVATLMAGRGLNAPDFGNHQIFSIMRDCWKTVPAERISFPRIIAKLDKIILNLDHVNNAPSSSTSTPQRQSELFYFAVE